MKAKILLILSVLALLAVPARASTVVEVVGRVVGTNLNNGPWAGVGVAEYLYMTRHQVVNNRTIAKSGAGAGPICLQFAVVPGTRHATIHGVPMDAPLVAGSGDYLSPTCKTVTTAQQQVSSC